MKPRDIPGWNAGEYLLMRLLVGVLGCLPLSAANAAASYLGRLGFLLGVKHRKVTLENLERVYGQSLSQEEKIKIAREAFRQLALSFMEFALLPKMLAQAEDHFEFEGMEHLDQALAQGKGMIAVISHLGSWEYLGFVPFLQGYPSSVVVRKIKNPYVDAWSRRRREATRLEPIDRENSIRRILRELKNNHIVAVLIDQWAGPEGLWMDFFGHPTSTTSIPARLASRTQAPLVPMYCLRTAPGRYRIKALPAVPVRGGEDWERETTRALNTQLENEILKNPAQWLWPHRRWKDSARHHAEKK